MHITSSKPKKYITIIAILICLMVLYIAYSRGGSRLQVSSHNMYSTPPAVIHGSEKRFRDSGIDFLYPEHLVNLGRMEDDGSIATLADMQSPYAKDAKMIRMNLYAFALQDNEVNSTAQQILRDKFEKTFQGLVDKKTIISFDITERAYKTTSVARLRAVEYVHKDKVITQVLLFKTDKSLYIIESLSLSRDEEKMNADIDFMLNSLTFYAPLPQNSPTNMTASSTRGLLQ